MAHGLDIAKLKEIAMSVWRQGEGSTLVKVTPKGFRPDPSRSAGYCTTIKYVLGRTPAEMEETLGFRKESKLAEGAEIFRVTPPPSAAQLELRGYSQTPEGISTAIKTPHADYPPGLGVPQWELKNYPQSGLVWLATVERGQRFVYDVGLLAQAAPAFMDTGRPR